MRVATEVWLVKIGGTFDGYISPGQTAPWTEVAWTRRRADEIARYNRQTGHEVRIVPATIIYNERKKEMS